MIEQMLKRLKDDMESLKTSLPISGSLLRTYCYSATAKKTMPDGEWFNYKIEFTPSNSNTGIMDISCYVELWTNSPTFSPYNPVGLGFNSGYTINSSGKYVLIDGGGFAASDGSTYEVRVIATAYGTLEGSVSISIY